MCAQVATSGEYLRGHGRVAVDVTALRRLWQHLLVLGLVVLACVPVGAVLRGIVNLNKDTIIIIFIPSVSRIPRDLETEKLEIENVRSDT